MNKKFRAIISVILSLLVIVCSTSVAFAKEKVTPVIVVHGMGTTPIYKIDSETGKKTKVPEIKLDTFTANDNFILKLLLDACKGNIKNTEQFIDHVADFMQNFTDVACDKNGGNNGVTNVNNWTDSMANHKSWLRSKVSNEPAITRQICDKIGANNVYLFNYDWRLDFCENAEKLNKLVDEVKKQKSCDKVTLIGGSEGTCIVSAYVDKYMNKNDLEKVVLLDGAITGVSAANAFAQDLFFDGNYLSKYVVGIANSYNNRTIDMRKLAFLGPILNGSLKNVCNLVNQVLADEALTAKFYNEALKPVFGNIPALWEFMTYDAFETAVDKMAKIGFLDKSTGLYKKISNYHKVQGRAAANIKKLQDKGVEVAVIANYNTPTVPITSEYKNHSDILIDTKYASMGATVADMGKTLPSTKTKNNPYASPDGIIDASTCAAKDNTWFVKDIQHMDFWYGSGACDFIATLTTTTTSTNIKDIKALTGIGQYVFTDRKQNVITVKDPTLTISTEKGSLTYTATVPSGTDGVEVQYSVDKKFNVYVTKTTKATNTVSVKSGKHYYVRTRAYKVVNGTKTYSDFVTKNIKIK